MMDGAYKEWGTAQKLRKRSTRRFELRDRLTARERYLRGTTVLFGLRDEKAPDKAIEAFKKYLELCPDDSAEIAGLGYVYMNFGDLARVWN